MKYCLEITEAQARIIRDACELFSRLHMGQIDELRHMNLSRRPDDDYLQTEFIIKALKLQLFPELAANAYYGIQSPEIPDSARIAYDLHQVIRRFLAGPKPEGEFSFVIYDEPMRTSEQVELAKITTVQEA